MVRLIIFAVILVLFVGCKDKEAERVQHFVSTRLDTLLPTLSAMSYDEIKQMHDESSDTDLQAFLHGYLSGLRTKKRLDSLRNVAPDSGS